LAGGPIHIVNHYMGPHYLALGSLLTFLGSTIMCLGILARVAVWMDYPIINDPTVAWLLKRFEPEKPLVAGVVLVGAGFIACCLLLWRYLHVGGPMESSIHAAFVATTAIAVGTVIVFSSFLLHLLIQHSKKLGEARKSGFPPPPG